MAPVGESAGGSVMFAQWPRGSPDPARTTLGRQCGRAARFSGRLSKWRRYNERHVKGKSTASRSGGARTRPILLKHNNPIWSGVRRSQPDAGPSVGPYQQIAE